MITSFLLVVLISAVSYWVWRRKRILSTFERIGIPGPKPRFFTGNLKEVIEKGVGPSQLEVIEKYGPIAGIFIGAIPMVLVTDPDLMKVIQIQEYASFNKREPLVKNASLPHRVFKDIFALKEAYHWKTYRNLLTPTISASKMRQIVQVWNTSFDAYFQKMDQLIASNRKLKQEGFNISDYLRMLTIENFLRSSLSVDLEMAFDPKDYTFRSIVKMTQARLDEFFIKLQMCFPELQGLFNGMRNGIDRLNLIFEKLPSFQKTADYFEKLVDFRQKNKDVIKKHDLFQAILDIRFNRSQPDVYRDLSSKQLKPEEVTGLRESEIRSDAMFLMMAGFETTSLLLGNLFHLLAQNQDVQNKLRAEIVGVLGGKPMQYDDMMKLPYLEQVVNEALRLYPSTITFTTRVTREEYTFKNYVFPKGLAFMVPVWVLHRSPDLWEDPLKFDPDRFSPERKAEIHSYKYQPFGLGQRICFGERYALNQIRAVTCQFLQRYKLEPSPKADMALPEVIDTILFIKPPKNGIQIRLVPLKEETK